MDKDRIARRMGAAAIIVVLLLVALSQWNAVGAMGNRLSPTADPWTEADTLRAGEGYARYGYLENAGLPDLAYGYQFADIGTKKLLSGGLDGYQAWVQGTITQRPSGETLSADKFIYTHYPPGPHWIAGVLTTTFGVGSVKTFRILPVTLGLLALAYLSLELVRYSDPVRASLVLIIVAVFPMTSNMMHGLSYQGYALAALQVEIALVLRLVRANNMGYAVSWAMFAIGFFQGWLGFDYVFLVVLSPLTIWLLHADVSGLGKVLAKASVAVLAGFGSAHLLHFLQLMAYFGDGQLAVRDLFSAAQYRSESAVFDNGTLTPGRLMVLWQYLTEKTALPLHFNVSMLAILFCSCLLVLAKRQYVRRTQVHTSGLAGLLAALLVSSLWVIVMPQHAAQHWHFIPRHYFLFVFVALLVTTSRSGQDKPKMWWRAGFAKLD